MLLKPEDLYPVPLREVEGSGTNCPLHPPFASLSAIWLGWEGFPISKTNPERPKYSWQGTTLQLTANVFIISSHL